MPIAFQVTDLKLRTGTVIVSRADYNANRLACLLVAKFLSNSSPATRGV